MPRSPRGPLSILFLVLAAAVVAACGEAATTGPELLTVDDPLMRHQPAPPPATAWTAAGPGTVNVVTDGTAGDAEMNYHLTGFAVFSTQSWTFSTTANTAGAVTLPFNYSGFHAFFQVRVFLEAFVSNTSGTTTTSIFSLGPVNCCTYPSGGFNESGSITLNVQAGDTYGFRFGGSNFDSNSTLQGTFIVDLPENPQTKADCKKGGWQNYGFRNQGLCIAYVNTGHDSR